MARQFKIEVTYAGPPVVTAEVFWHDNDVIEFVTVPPNVGPDSLTQRTRLLEELIQYAKKQVVTKIEITKGPPF